MKKQDWKTKIYPVESRIRGFLATSTIDFLYRIQQTGFLSGDQGIFLGSAVY